MDRHEDLRWDADLRLFSGAMLLRWSAAVAVTLLVMALIMGVALVPGEGWTTYFRMLPLFAAVAGGLWLLGVLVMAIVFRGRYGVRYTLSDTGILLETRSKAAKVANRAVVVVGLLAGKPGAAGAGLIAQSQETQEIRWGGPLRVEASDADHVVKLKGPWRSLIAIFVAAVAWLAWTSLAAIRGRIRSAFAADMDDMDGG